MLASAGYPVGSVLLPENEYRALDLPLPVAVGAEVIGANTFVRIASRPGIEVHVNEAEGRIGSRERDATFSPGFKIRNGVLCDNQ